jgi:hypothetical protein
MELRLVAIHPTLKHIDARIEEAFFKETKILCEGSWAAGESRDNSDVRRPLEQFLRRSAAFRVIFAEFYKI